MVFYHALLATNNTDALTTCQKKTVGNRFNAAVGIIKVMKKCVLRMSGMCQILAQEVTRKGRERGLPVDRELNEGRRGRWKVHGGHNAEK